MKAILLDLDGTLINSEKAFSKCFIDVLNNNYNLKITPKEYKKNELEKNAMLIKYLKEQSMIDKNISDNEIMNLVYKEYEKYFKEVIQEKEAKNNFELIRLLKHKYKLALVTTCRRYYLDILDNYESIYELFDIVIAREDVKRLKPNPEAYLKVLDSLCLNNKEVIAIEDSKRGIDASINANIKTIKVDNYTEIKFEDERCIQEESANKVLRKIINYK